MAVTLDVDFRQIRSLEGRQDIAFEEFCCQIARRARDVPPGSRFTRYRGAGGDGGVECVWTLPSGEEWGWQAKYIFRLDKRQLDRSVETALEIHPNLTRYIVCLPFNLTPPTGRRGRSQLERYREYEQEWRSWAESRGMQVEFLRLCKSELLDELLEFDPHGGRLRFWFDKDRFGEEWFEAHLRETARAAEPRYTPQLSVDVPVAAAFEALGRTPRWERSVSELARKIDKASKHWSDSYTKPGFGGPEDLEFPTAAMYSAEQLAARLRGIKQGLSDLLSHTWDTDPVSELEVSLGEALDLASECLTVAIDDLEAKYGEGMADSVGFRHFMAEYQVSFPAQHVDTAREVIADLEELRDWLSRPEAHLPMSSAMLLLGPAGIGKTHAMCDSALERHKRGLRSVALLGERFNYVTGEPWERIRSLLGLGADVSRDELFGILDAAGECTGYPLILFIDALNETEPRKFWYDSLSSLVEQISGYDWLKLCVSCRSTYYEDVVASNVQILEVEHTGFAGVEFDACFEFFRFYGLEPPSMPLMQPEFSNPLFLRLVCESLSDAGVKRLPEGMMGISEVVRYLLSSKNERLARALDYNPRERLVQEAVDLIVSAMQENRTRWLSWQRAKELVDSVWPSLERSSSLFDHLLREGLIREDRVADPSGSETEDAVFIGFERLADLLLAEMYLSEISKAHSAHGRDGVLGVVHSLWLRMRRVLSSAWGKPRPPVERAANDLSSLRTAFASGGVLHFTVRDTQAVRENRGLLEALAILVPEGYGIELSRVVGERAFDPALTRIIVESLMWRADSSMDWRTGEIVRRALGDNRTFDPVMEALLGLSTRVGNPLSALWFHSFLSSIPMPDRDAKLCPYLHRAFGRQQGLDRLIRWALNADLGAVSDETAELWATQLCWFCAASDRRVRDYATKAMVRLMEDHPTKWPPIIKRFSRIDDEYVIERCLAAAYGSLIRADHNDAIKETALAVYEAFFEDGLLPRNAMVRDYARLILELAAYRDLLPEHVILEQFRPPYESEWPLDWPGEDFVEQYKDSYWELPKLYHSCLIDDFARYTVPGALRGYKGLQMPQALRWIFRHVLDMGYTTERFANFDGCMLSKYGPGRAKPAWAERVGKKYQWIALYRLMARVADHLPTGRSEWDPPRLSAPQLQAWGERNIDPTILLKRDQGSESTAWWAPIDYDFAAVSALSDGEWLDAKDFPDSAAMLKVEDPRERREWLVLEAYPRWSSRGDGEDGYPYRQIWMQVRSYLVPRRDYEKCWEWLRRQNFMGRWMPEGFEIHGGFLGEYPWGLPFVHFLEEAYFEQPFGERGRSRTLCRMLPTAHWVSCNHQFDAYQEDAISILVPAEIFFSGNNLHWNSLSGYQSDTGKLCFNYPATVEVGPAALLVDSEYLLAFLEKNDWVLAWTVLAEKQCIRGVPAFHDLGYAERSRAHMLMDGEIKSAKGITNRVKPKRMTDAG